MISTKRNWAYCKVLMIMTLSAALVVACSVAMVKSDGASAARTKLTQLQADPNLASRAPVAIKDAELAVAAAEMPQHDAPLAAHQAYIAERKVDTARALAETRYAEDQRTALSMQRDKVRLAARTREADAATKQVAIAQADSANQKMATNEARSETLAANAAAASAEAQSAELLRQIDVLQAKVTDRGLVLTLGDVLFASGRAELKSFTNGNLNKLAVFLGKYPERSVSIEGHTDSVGSAEYNKKLSGQRAQSVVKWLTAHGVPADRLSGVGMGKDKPLVPNDTDLNRALNRRVEFHIEDQAPTSKEVVKTPGGALVPAPPATKPIPEGAAPTPKKDIPKP